MSKELMLCRVALKNWKNFANVNVVTQERAFLVGPNASGKSIFLDVFRFLRDLASAGGGFQESIRRRGGITAIRCLSARRHSDVEVTVELKDRDDTSQWVYEVAFNQDKQRRPLLREERVLLNREVLLERARSR
jgi:predicted ATPase